MNLYEKLNRLDDSLVESKRVVKKKKLTEKLHANEYKVVYHDNTAGRERRPETIEDIENDWHEVVFRADSNLDAWKEAFDRVKGHSYDDYLDKDAIEEDFINYFENSDWGDGSPILIKLSSSDSDLYDTGYTLESWIDEFVEQDYDDNIDEMLTEGYSNEMTEFMNWIQEYRNGALWNDFATEFESEEDPDISVVLTWLENFDEDAYYDYVASDTYDDDIDEMLIESTEQYELSTLVKDSINHLVNDLGKDSMADDFGDDVCADLENNYDIDVPQNSVKYADWCDAVMSEVSRQLNNKEELTEATIKDWADSDLEGSGLWDTLDSAQSSDYKFFNDNLKTEGSYEDLKKMYIDCDSEYGCLFNCKIDDVNKIVYYSTSRVRI
jgi:hypothetical protein